MLSRPLETRCGVLETRSRVVETLNGVLETLGRVVKTLSRQVETQNRAVETLSGALETHFRGIETRLSCPGARLKLFFRYSEHSFDHSNDYSLRLKTSDDHFKDHFLLSKNFWGRFNRTRIQFYPSELYPNRQFLLSHESLLLLRWIRKVSDGPKLLTKINHYL